MRRMSKSKILNSEISLLPVRGKKWSVRAAAVFPNRYSVGMSNLGFLSLFEAMHNFHEFYPQRFFTDFEYSLEENAPLSAFPLIAVSIPFELDYLNLIAMLREGGIPVLSDERSGHIIG